MGGESASRQNKLTSLPPEVATIISEDEQIAELERKETLDALEKKAGLSQQQAAVWQWLRRGTEIKEIAAELVISENSVSVQKHNAVKKPKRLGEPPGSSSKNLSKKFSSSLRFAPTHCIGGRSKPV